jgi:hypothetical protein
VALPAAIRGRLFAFNDDTVHCKEVPVGVGERQPDLSCLGTLNLVVDVGVEGVRIRLRVGMGVGASVACGYQDRAWCTE